MAIIGLIALGALGFCVCQFLVTGGPLRSPASQQEQPLDLAGFPRLPTTEAEYVSGVFFCRDIKDPLSLTDIRDAFDRAGYRGAATLAGELENNDWSLEHLRRRGPPVFGENRLDYRFMIACCHLWEGDLNKAAEVLRDIRALAERQPERFRAGLSTTIFLQGVVELRRGETENCVECQCESSCIFPLRAEAVHQKREGSTQAIAFFSEYLQHHPDDIGVQWLLNLAYMTLGEYPQQVPPQHLIPLAPFESAMDIGRFRDIAPALGINRLNMSGGAIMDDFDNDGLLDIVESSWDAGEGMAFYRNRGDGTFEDRTKAAGLDQQLGAFYCVQGDYNNDGWLDIFVARGGWMEIGVRQSLLRNNGDATFSDVTQEAGLMNPHISQVAAWADYDNDGWLDLFQGGERMPSRLYHNRRDGTFEEVAVKAGVASPGSLCKGANWGDFDGDGYPDLFVNNLRGVPRLFRNNRDGTFTDVAPELGIRHPQMGFPCWFWDYDNDGWLDILACGFERSLNQVINSSLGRPHTGVTCRLYRNKEGQGFEDVSEAVGLNMAVAPMGCNFADLDNDGYLDFYLGTGSPEYSMLTPNRMFKNVKGERFVDITTSSGTGHLQKGHGVAAGDWDRDGNVDLYVQMGGAMPGDAFHNVLFQNPGHDNNWLRVKLVGAVTNRAAIGARIKVVPAGDGARPIYRHVTSGSSFGGNPLEQHIGIGKAQTIAQIEIYWPTSGTLQSFTDVEASQAIEIKELDATFRRLESTPIRHSH